MEINDGVTVAAWVRLNQIDAVQGILSFALVDDFENPVENVECGLTFDPFMANFDGGGVAFYCHNDYEDATVTAACDSPFTANVWIHVAVIIDEFSSAAGPLASIAFDGVPVARSAPENLGADLKVKTLTAGQDGQGGSFDGYFDDLGVYSTALVGPELEVVKSGAMAEKPECSKYTDINTVPIYPDSATGRLSTNEIDAVQCDSFYTTLVATSPAAHSAGRYSHWDSDAGASGQYVDDGLPYAEATGFCVFRTFVVDLNDAPEFDKEHYAFEVLEDALVNQKIGKPLVNNVTEPDVMQSSIFAFPKRAEIDAMLAVDANAFFGSLCEDNDDEDNEVENPFGIEACTGQIFVK